MNEKPGRRPEWLQRKHSGRPADPKLTEWADRMAQELYGRWGQAVPLGPFRSEQAARSAKNALYDAAYKRRNRYQPDEPLSLSANVTNPDDGRCYARGSCRCEQNGCQATAGPGWYIHARLYDKSQGRAHQGAKPREQWDYDPMIPRNHQTAKEPGRAFGADRFPAGEDQPPDRSGFRRTPKPAAPSAGRTARASGSARGRQQQAPAPPADEGALA